jgi:UDP-glucose 4-epimerase
MKVIITGGTGFIATRFYELKKSKHKISLLTRKRGLERKYSRFIYSDYSIESLKSILKYYDAIIHTAARRIITKYEMFNDFILNNVLLTQKVFEAAKIAEVCNLVQLSSRMVYPSNSEKPLREDSITQPDTYYGLSKVFCEKLADFYSDLGLKIKTLRLSQVIGKGDKKRETFFLNKIIEQAEKKQKITIYGKGMGKKDYVYIDDVVDAIDKALIYSKTNIFNIASGVSKSYVEIAEVVNELCENKGNITFLDIKGDENIVYYDITKAKEFLNFIPKYDFRSAIIKILED